MIIDGLETARLRFKSITHEDQSDLMQYYGDPEVTKYYFFDSDNAEANCKHSIERQLWRYKTYNSGLAMLMDKVTGSFVGLCGILHQQVGDEMYVEIAYGLLKKYWGNGLAIEAASFCRDFAFKKEMSETLVSMIHPKNLNSQHLAQRNGMTLSQKVSLKGHELRIYRITKKEWLQLI